MSTFYLPLQCQDALRRGHPFHHATAHMMNAAPQTPGMHQAPSGPTTPKNTPSDKDEGASGLGTTTNNIVVTEAEVHAENSDTETTVKRIHSSASPTPSRFNDSQVVSPNDISTAQLLPQRSPLHRENNQSDHILETPNTPHHSKCGHNIISMGDIASTPRKHAQIPFGTLDESVILTQVTNFL
jgi:hypothetical protein